MVQKIALFIVLIATLNSCASSRIKDGGPCTYKKTTFVGDLVSINTGVATFRANDGQMYSVPYNFLTSDYSLVPKRLYKVEFNEILTGTCTPYYGQIQSL